MTLNRQISNLTQSLHILDHELAVLRKSDNADQKVIESKVKERYNIQQEITRLNRLSWEESYERTGYGDDR